MTQAATGLPAQGQCLLRSLEAWHALLKYRAGLEYVQVLGVPVRFSAQREVQPEHLAVVQQLSTAEVELGHLRTNRALVLLMQALPFMSHVLLSSLLSC